MSAMKHTPKHLSAVRSDLWGDTPWHQHVLLARVIEHSPMNGMDAVQLAEEIAVRWNCHDDLVAALKEAEDYFNGRADADREDGQYIPNEEMVLLIAVRSAIAKAEVLS